MVGSLSINQFQKYFQGSFEVDAKRDCESLNLIQ